MRIDNLKQEALQMYLMRIPGVEIAKQLKKNRRTIVNWIKKGNWSQVREKIDEGAVKNARENLDQRKERLLKISKHIQAVALKRIKEQGEEVNPGHLFKAMEFEAKMEGLITEKHEIKTDQPIQIQLIEKSVKEIKNAREARYKPKTD